MNVIYPCCRRMYADQRGRYEAVNDQFWDTELRKFTRNNCVNFENGQYPRQVFGQNQKHTIKIVTAKNNLDRWIV